LRKSSISKSFVGVLAPWSIGKEVLNSFFKASVWVEALEKHEPKNNACFVDSSISKWLEIISLLDIHPFL
jgi:hypothetical protein